MKSLLAILLIAGIAGGAVVGMLTMNHDGNCFVSDAIGMACAQLNLLAYIGIHVSFIQNFSKALLIITLSLVLSAAFLVFSVSSFNNSYLDTGLCRIRFFAIYNIFRRKQISWLTLFENSPTFEFRAVI